MRAPSPPISTACAERAPTRRGGAVDLFGLAAAAVVALGAFLDWLSASRPALMPVWAPWEFSWTLYLGTTLAVLFFCRGYALTSRSARPPLWHGVLFLSGVLMIYAALQTRFDYMAQHMFFLNRVQQVAIHDLAPFLIALAGAGVTLCRGLPDRAYAWLEAPVARAVIGFLRRPLVAAPLFVGLFYFWLIPGVHFRTMLDARLYFVMNVSMVLDGLLFWSIVLDRRPCPPAPHSFALRAATGFAVMTPQTLFGAVVTLAPRDLYPSYALCGRLYPNIDVMTDQHLGGIISWVPPLLIGAIALLIILARLLQDKPRPGEARP
jgi:putative membrane protein